MKRLLFVDDEPRILAGIQRMLHGRRAEWECHFAEGGEMALAIMAKSTFDVVISDCRMPGMDGATLLERVRDLNPGCARVILSGESEPEMTMRALRVAHQFLSKPCDKAKLQGAVERTLRIQELLSDETLRSVLNRVRSLPSPPVTYHALVAEASKTDPDIDRMSSIVARDIAVSAKVLQIVNSSFFGLSRHISEIRQAVALLGINPLKNIVLSAEIFSKFDSSTLPAGFDLDAEIEHATACSQVARRISHDKASAETNVVAALLHDIGRWTMASHLPDMFARVEARQRSDGCSWSEAEALVGVVDHGRVGAFLLGIWGVPHALVEAVAFHHEPSRVSSTTFDAVGTVHVADIIVRALGTSTQEARQKQLDRLDRKYLIAVGVESRIPEWLEISASCLLKAA